MKKLFFLLLVFVLLFPAAAQENIREQIARVELSLNQTIKDQYTEESTRQEERNDRGRAEAYKQAAGDWSGSGFLYDHSNGTTYFITNRHVADFGETTKVIFENRNETILETEDVVLLYLDDELDVAVYTLGATFAEMHPRGFQFLAGEIQDGTEVWAAGYPGLITKPAWQLSRGVVTNGWALVDELVDSKLSHLIQHSAPVDPGNSGGPLLVAQGNQDYVVAGVNTWRVYDRANTFFAVPASTVLSVVEKAIQVEGGLDKGALEELLEARLLKFLEAQNGPDYRGRDLFYVSQDLVIREGFATFQEKLKQSVPSLRKRIEESFFYGSGENTLREVIYLNLYEGMKKVRTGTEDGQWQLDSFSISSAMGVWKGDSRFTLGDDELKLGWIFENGNWKISDTGAMPEVKEDKPKRKSSYSAGGFRIAVNGGIAIANGEISKMPNFGLGLSFVNASRTNTFSEYGLVLGYFAVPGVSAYDEWDNQIGTGELRGFNLGFNMNWGMTFSGAASEKLKVVPGFSIGGEFGVQLKNKLYEDGVSSDIDGFLFDGIYLGGKARFLLDFFKPEFEKIIWGVYLEGQYNFGFNAGGGVDSALLKFGVVSLGASLRFY